MGSGGRDARSRRVALALAVALFTVLIPAVALAAYPGSNPTRASASTRPTTPATTRPSRTATRRRARTSSTTSTRASASRRTRARAPPSTTRRRRPPARSRRTPPRGATRSGRSPGVSADRAWKFFGEDDPNGLVGDPDVEIAILDTGIRWSSESLRLRVSLNEGELPEPQLAGGADCGADDCNEDGAFNVDDFADDPRVAPTDGNPDADSILDGSDLIAAFGNDGDTDGNGYPDDVAGWDFFDDDNDPFDASSYSAAVFPRHRAGQRRRQEGDDGDGGIGVCPRLPDRAAAVWDTFVVDTNNFAQGVLYAADNEVEVVEGAVGGLLNSRFARESFEYAYSKGTLPRDRLLRPQHGRPQLPDQLRPGAARPGHGRRRQRPRREPAAAVRQLLRRPAGAAADRLERSRPDLVPQLGHDPVRRARPHRDAGDDRLGGHRTGVGRGRADHLLRQPQGDHAASRTRSSSCSPGPPRTSIRATPTASGPPTRRRSAGTSTSATAAPTSASPCSGSRTSPTRRPRTPARASRRRR